MSRKKFPSDLNTTTVRVKRTLHKEISKTAQRQKKTIETCVDVALTAAVRK